jgi:capsular exopolysaccharide synthesis family protein
VSLIGAVLGLAVARLTPESFQSTSSVFVSTQRGETSAELVQGSTFTQNIVQSYSQLATMPIVLDPVIARLDLNTTAANLAKEVTAETISEELATAVQRISPRSDSNVPVVALESVARATPSASRSAPNTPLLVASGGGIGLVLGYAFILLRAVMDTRIRTEYELQRTGDIPVLGVIGRQSGARSGADRPGAVFSEPLAEAYRRLATNIEFLDPDTKISSITVTSSMPGEGKTTTAISLALAAGELTPRVLIVDADLRRPSVAKYCGIEGAVGLTSVLAGQVSLEEAVEPWNHIHVLTTGSLPPNPSQIVNSNAMADLMVKITHSYDLVIVDSPPLLPVTDSLALSRITDGALIVVRFKMTRRQQVRSSLAALEAVKARAVGVVLNRVTQRNRDAEYVYERIATGSPWEKSLAKVSLLRKRIGRWLTAKGTRNQAAAGGGKSRGFQAPHSSVHGRADKPSRP